MGDTTLQAPAGAKPRVYVKGRTQKTRLIEALTQLGFEIDHDAVTTKYVVMRKLVGANASLDKRYYIGASGALRYGRTVTESVALEQVKSKLLKRVAA